MATSYVTSAEVRSFAGFTNNTYILDATIDTLRARAKARINTVVGAKYLLPITDTDVVAYLGSIEILLA